jgi:hypothetical protein
MAAHPPHIVEQARDLVTTTTRRLADIAAELGISLSTLGTWVRRHAWTRPPGVLRARTKIPRSMYPALQRIFENRARMADIAVVARCSLTRLTVIAANEGWTPRRESAAGAAPANQPLSAALAEIQAALRDPALARKDLLALLDRSVALTAADALGGDRGAERKVQTITRLASVIKNRRNDAAGDRDTTADAADHFPDANDLIEEIARRFEEFCAAEDAGAFSEHPAGASP